MCRILVKVKIKKEESIEKNRGIFLYFLAGIFSGVNTVAFLMAKSREEARTGYG